MKLKKSHTQNRVHSGSIGQLGWVRFIGWIGWL